MPKSNLERMIQLAEDVFAVKNDPNQLDVDQNAIERLQKMHPSTLSEHDDGNGPVAWILMFPTTLELMNQFLENKISEKELFEQTPLNIKYEALYLCSALVLEEYRKKGLAKQLTLNAIEQIRKDHPIKAIFVWPFTPEGDATATKIADIVGLPFYKHLE